MPGSGWYPDPDGTPDRFRYWDGSGWSAETADDPRQPRPASASGPERHGSGVGPVLGVLAVVVVIVVAGVVIFRERQVTDDGVPFSSVSAWDDSSPSGQPAPTGSSPYRPAPCATGAPQLRGSHPTDGRIYGGNLSFPEVPIFRPAAPEPRLSFAYDVTQQYLSVNEDPGWIAQLALGELRAADGFKGSARIAAENFVRCALSGAMYAPYSPTRIDVRSNPITVSGKQGWLIEAEIRVLATGLPFQGDNAVFLVVEDGRDWGLFFGAVPIGNFELKAVLLRTVAALRAS